MHFKGLTNSESSKNERIRARETKKQMNSPTLELLTLKEACDLLHVHPNTLRNWEKEGKIQAIRIGTRRDRRFLKASIEAMYQGIPTLQMN